METVVNIAGWAALGLLALALVVGVVAFVVGMVRDGLFRRADRLREEGAEHARTLFCANAHWFSEDEATWRAMSELGQGQPVSAVRERWRRTRALEARKEEA